MPLGKSIFSPFSYQCFASGNEEDIWMSALLVGYREVSVLCAAVLVEYREFCTVSCCTESSVLCAAVLVEYREFCTVSCCTERYLYCVLLFW